MSRWAFNLILILILLAGGIYVHSQNNKWLPVLCASKESLQDQINDSYIRIHRQQDFLYEYDTGQRSGLKGFRRADIVLAISDTQGVIDRQIQAFGAYESLNCKGVK